eukprot:363788-Prymnesium_polylepis.1
MSPRCVIPLGDPPCYPRCASPKGRRRALSHGPLFFLAAAASCPDGAANACSSSACASWPSLRFG